MRISDWSSDVCSSDLAMADITSQDMATKLLAAGFERNSSSASALSDPIADTPMIVTLDQLRPYDHDPRMKRNSAYDEIKASIRERGLDASPAITRRLGARSEEHTSELQSLMRISYAV